MTPTAASGGGGGADAASQLPLAGCRSHAHQEAAVDLRAPVSAGSRCARCATSVLPPDGAIIAQQLAKSLSGRTVDSVAIKTAAAFTMCAACGTRCSRQVQDELGQLGLVETLAAAAAQITAGLLGPANELCCYDTLHALRNLCSGHVPNAWRLQRAGGWAAIKAVLASSIVLQAQSLCHQLLTELACLEGADLGQLLELLAMICNVLQQHHQRQLPDARAGAAAEAAAWCLSRLAAEALLHSGRLRCEQWVQLGRQHLWPLLSCQVLSLVLEELRSCPLQAHVLLQHLMRYVCTVAQASRFWANSSGSAPPQHAQQQTMATHLLSAAGNTVLSLCSAASEPLLLAGALRCLQAQACCPLELRLEVQPHAWVDTVLAAMAAARTAAATAGGGDEELAMHATLLVQVHGLCCLGQALKRGWLQHVSAPPALIPAVHAAMGVVALVLEHQPSHMQQLAITACPDRAAVGACVCRLGHACYGAHWRLDSADVAAAAAAAAELLQCGGGTTGVNSVDASGAGMLHRLAAAGQGQVLVAFMAAAGPQLNLRLQDGNGQDAETVARSCNKAAIAELLALAARDSPATSLPAQAWAMSAQDGSNASHDPQTHRLGPLSPFAPSAQVQLQPEDNGQSGGGLHSTWQRAPGSTASAPTQKPVTSSEQSLEQMLTSLSSFGASALSPNQSPARQQIASALQRKSVQQQQQQQQLMSMSSLSPSGRLGTVQASPSWGSASLPQMVADRGSPQDQLSSGSSWRAAKSPTISPGKAVAATASQDAGPSSGTAVASQAAVGSSPSKGHGSKPHSEAVAELATALSGLAVGGSRPAVGSKSNQVSPAKQVVASSDCSVDSVDKQAAQGSAPFGSRSNAMAIPTADISAKPARAKHSQHNSSGMDSSDGERFRSTLYVNSSGSGRESSSSLAAESNESDARSSGDEDSPVCLLHGNDSSGDGDGSGSAPADASASDGAADQDDCDGEAQEEGDAEGKPSRHLWLGNIPLRPNKAAMELLFSNFGALESVRVFPGKTFAFVNFMVAADAIAAKTALDGQAAPAVTGVKPMAIRYQKNTPALPSGGNTASEGIIRRMPSSGTGILSHSSSAVNLNLSSLPGLASAGVTSLAPLLDTEAPAAPEPAVNLSNRLNPNNVHFDKELACRYKRMSKVEKEALWAQDRVLQQMTNGNAAVLGGETAVAAVAAAAVAAAAQLFPGASPMGLQQQQTAAVMAALTQPSTVGGMNALHRALSSGALDLAHVGAEAAGRFGTAAGAGTQSSYQGLLSSAQQMAAATAAANAMAAQQLLQQQAAGLNLNLLSAQQLTAAGAGMRPPSVELLQQALLQQQQQQQQQQQNRLLQAQLLQQQQQLLTAQHLDASNGGLWQQQQQQLLLQAQAQANHHQQQQLFGLHSSSFPASGLAQRLSGSPLQAVLDQAQGLSHAASTPNLMPHAASTPNLFQLGANTAQLPASFAQLSNVELGTAGNSIAALPQLAIGEWLLQHDVSQVPGMPLTNKFLS